MPKPQLYVFLSGSKIRVRKEQKQLIDQYCTRRGVSTSQAIRDVIDHADLYGFFNGTVIANGNVSSVEGK